MSTVRSSQISALAKKIIANVEKVIIGKRQEVVLALVAYFCEGHILLEDVPGVAKTMLARALAKSVGCSFKRVQCTPDLLPTDVTGASIFNQKTTEFEFRPGRSSRRSCWPTKSIAPRRARSRRCLEAMAERRVTVDGTTHALAPPFLVIATQNPIDHEGTFPLPEAQLDRFLVRLSLGYPSQEEEAEMLERLQRGHPIDDLTAGGLGRRSARLPAGRARGVRRRKGAQLHRGADSRHARARRRAAWAAARGRRWRCFRTAQALAAMRGHNFVLPDDVKRMAPAVLAHRLILRPESRLRKVTAGNGRRTRFSTKSPVPTLANEASRS